MPEVKQEGGEIDMSGDQFGYLTNRNKHGYDSSNDFRTVQKQNRKSNMENPYVCGNCRFRRENLCKIDAPKPITIMPKDEDKRAIPLWPYVHENCIACGQFERAYSNADRR